MGLRPGQFVAGLIGLAGCLWVGGCAAPAATGAVVVQQWRLQADGGSQPVETIRVRSLGSDAIVEWKVNYPDRSVLRTGVADRKAAQRLFEELDGLGIWTLESSYAREAATETIVKVTRDQRQHRFEWQAGANGDAEAREEIARLCREFGEVWASETTEYLPLQPPPVSP